MSTELNSEEAGADSSAKQIWSTDDIEAGMLVCKRPGPSGPSDLWFAKWAYKIGWAGSQSSDRHWTMIAILSDGLVHRSRTKEEIVDWLNEEQMVRMTMDWLLTAIPAVRSTLGLVASDLGTASVTCRQFWRDIVAGETVRPGDRIMTEDGDWKTTKRTFVFSDVMWPVQRRVDLMDTAAESSLLLTAVKSILRFAYLANQTCGAYEELEKAVALVESRQTSA